MVNRIVWRINKFLLKIVTAPYDKESEGLEDLYSNSTGSMIIYKHHSAFDFPILCSLLPECTFLAESRLLKYVPPPFAQYMIASGLEPMVTPKAKLEDPTNSKPYANRNTSKILSMFNRLKAGHRYAYSIEGGRMPGRVGELEYPELIRLLIMSANLGIDIYLLGLKYETKKIFRWKPFENTYWMPFFKKVKIKASKHHIDKDLIKQVKAAHYDPDHDAFKRIKDEVRGELVNLSQLL